jgi:hypothetical protein
LRVILHFIYYLSHWEFLCGWLRVHLVSILSGFKSPSSFWYGSGENSWILYMSLDYSVSALSYMILVCRYIWSLWYFLH